MLLWERRALRKGASIIIGLDEAGRGPLAGPVVAAAVLLDPLSQAKKINFPDYKERIDDSKKISSLQRERSFSEISKKSLFGVGMADHFFIDDKNIRIATIFAMRKAVELLIKKYCVRFNKEEKDVRKKVCVLIDGNFGPDIPYDSVLIKKGDSKSYSIAAASIIAKVTRDRLMIDYDRKYPGYGFSKHKGYGTKTHLAAIEKYGPCQIHRKTFAPINKR